MPNNSKRYKIYKTYFNKADLAQLYLNITRLFTKLLSVIIIILFTHIKNCSYFCIWRWSKGLVNVNKLKTEQFRLLTATYTVINNSIYPPVS